jgi:hypothetical protein
MAMAMAVVIPPLVGDEFATLRVTSDKAGIEVQSSCIRALDGVG